MRLRITFSKTGTLRYTGHLDLQTTWERTVRRAGLPLAYTHGFHPGPRLQIASALPLGFIGRAEIVDIWLQEPVGSEHPLVESDHPGHLIAERLQRAAPPGLSILSVEIVDEGGPALQTQVTAAEYEVTLLDPTEETELTQRIVLTLQADSLPGERRGKPYNLRPMIEELFLLPASPQQSASLSDKGQEVKIFMRLAARPGATARPEAVLNVLGIPSEATRIERTRLFLESEMEQAQEK